MRLYLVTRDDGWDYEEYDAFVIRAESEGRAREMVLGDPVQPYEWMKGEPMPGFTPTNLVIEPLTESGPESIVISSFHAG